jgi:hypothetical protein
MPGHHSTVQVSPLPPEALGKTPTQAGLVISGISFEPFSLARFGIMRRDDDRHDDINKTLLLLFWNHAKERQTADGRFGWREV